MIRTVWVTGSKKEAAFDIKIAQELESLGMSVLLVTDFGETYTYVKDQGFSIILVPLSRPRAALTDDSVLEISGRYPIIEKLIRIDDALKTIDLQEARRFAASYFLFWEKLLRDQNIDAVITMGTRGLAGRSCIATAKQIDLLTLEFLGGSKPYGSFSITDNGELQWMWSELIEMYENTKETPLTDDIRERVMRDITDWRECRGQLKHVFVSNSRNKKKLAYFVLSLKHIVFKILKYAPSSVCYSLENMIKKFVLSFVLPDKLKRNKGLPGYAYERDDAFEIAFAKSEARRRNWAREIEPFVNYQEPKEGEQYVYFPLYFESDIPLYAWGTFLYNQVGLVETFSKAIPEGYKLYVKQHPYGLGDFSIEQLRQMQSYTNVRLIDPAVSNIDLIHDMDLMLNIGSTAGYEAFLLRKPVAVLTRPFYSLCDLIYFIDSPELAASIIKTALEAGGLIYNKKEKHWYHMIDSIFRTVYSGEIWDYKPMWGSAGISSFKIENIEIVARQIYNKLHRSLFPDSNLLKEVSK
jgi:hypothetical protein